MPNERKRLEDEIAEILGEPAPPSPRAASQRRLTNRTGLIRALLTWVARGQTVVAFCKQPGTPCVRTIYNWLDKDLVFADEFRRAKAVGYDILAQQCLDIADHGGPEDVAHRKLRIWTRLQLLARWDSARYGDKIMVGGDGGQPIRLTDDAAMSEIMRLLATAKARQLRDPHNRLTGEHRN